MSSSCVYASDPFARHWLGQIVLSQDLDPRVSLVQYMIPTNIICFGDDLGASPHPIFPGCCRGAAFHEGGGQGRHRPTAAQPANQGPRTGGWCCAVSSFGPRRRAYRGGESVLGRREGDALDRPEGDDGGAPRGAWRTGVAACRLHLNR